MTGIDISERACGIVILDAALLEDWDERWFDRAHWMQAGAREHSSTGRSPVLIGQHGEETWVLRHYSRGGFVAHFVHDHYLWLGLERTRAYKEWMLLWRMRAWGLPVPSPVAARIRRNLLTYQADIITRYLPGTQALSAHLRREGVPPEVWRRIGAMVRNFHDHGVDHPDLTAHNILVDAGRAVHLVDFDSAEIRAPGAWRERGVARLERSLRKVALETGTEFDTAGWQTLVAAYRGTQP